MEDFGTGLQSPLNAVGRAKWAVLVGSMEEMCALRGLILEVSKGNKNFIRK